MSGFVHGRDIASDLKLTADVCIVGSGAGGSVLAARLSEMGRSVVVLEEGGYYTKGEFVLHEKEAMANLYQQAGLRTTNDKSIAVMQGRTVGGSTTVNWTTCFRTPDRIPAHWKDVNGVTTLSSEVLRPHFEAVEARLNIQPWPVERQNANNATLWRGAGKLGWHRGQIRRNVLRCMNSGYCGFGCPVDAKQAMHLTFLPDAVEHGATIYADTRAERVEMSGRRATRVRASVLDRKTSRPTGRTVEVEAKIVAVCGGAINTPMLLQQSGLTAGGLVGKRTFMHPATALLGFYEDQISPYYGAPQSAYSHQFVEPEAGEIGFFHEVAPLHPMLTAVAMGGFGRPHQEAMSRLPNASGMAGLLVDGLLPQEAGATVSRRSDGRPSIDYPLGALQMNAFRKMFETIARLHFAAGAQEVRSLHTNPVVMKSEAEIDKLRKAPMEPLRFPIFTFHQMGGAGMGGPGRDTVVDDRLRLREADNVFVVDGSTFPTALGVNPSETIYGLSRWASSHISDAV